MTCSGHSHVLKTCRFSGILFVTLKYFYFQLILFCLALAIDFGNGRTRTKRQSECTHVGADRCAYNAWDPNFRGPLRDTIKKAITATAKLGNTSYSQARDNRNICIKNCAKETLDVERCINVICTDLTLFRAQYYIDNCASVC